MTPELTSNIYALLFGFAMAGLLASAYQLFADRPVSFRLLGAPTGAALMSIPLLTFCAPFIIMRNTVRGTRIENRRFEVAMIATVLACFWSLMCGTVVLSLLSQVFA